MERQPSRLELLQESDDSDTSSQKVLRMADIDALTDSNDNSRILETLDDYQEAFNLLMIPEMDIIDTDKQVLLKTIQNMTELRNSLLRSNMAASQDSLLVDSPVLELLETMGREILLYEQFVDTVASGMTLEQIMQQPMEEEAVIDDAVEHLDDEGISVVASAVKDAVPTNEKLFSISIPSIAGLRRVSMASSAYIPSLRTIQSRHNVSSLSTDSTPLLNNEAISTIPPGPYDCVRWTKLLKLSNAVHSASFVAQMGNPTVLAVASGIAIGTSNSVVLLFSLKQELKAVLGVPSVQQIDLLGPVTSIRASFDQRMIICGYAKGHIIIWDEQLYTVIKSIPPVSLTEFVTAKKDGHEPSCSVIHISSLSKTSFVTADDHGTAFYHVVSRGILSTTVKSTRIHGQRADSQKHHERLPTTIFALSGLSPSQVPYSGDTNRLIALATPYKMGIIALKPVPQILYRMPWNLQNKIDVSTPRRPVAIAALDWWTPVVNKTGAVLGTPRLAYSHANHLRIIQVQFSSTEIDRTRRKLKFTEIGSYDAPENVVTIRWINESLLACLTRSEQIIFIHAGSCRFMESTSVANLQLVFQPSFYNPMAAFNMDMDLCYSNSFCVYHGRLLFLTGIDVSVAGLIPWKDRLASLIRVGMFRDAFEIATSFYRCEHRFVAAGVVRQEQLFKQQVNEHVSGLISSYTSMCLSGYDASLNEDISLYRQSADTIFNTCISFERQDMLFEEIYDRFRSVHLEYVFFEQLEPFVLSEQIVKIPNTSVVQSWVDHYMNSSWADRLEQILLHLDPSTLDINQILHFCRLHGLYSALIYIHNSVLTDFIGPLIDLLTICDELQRPSRSSTSKMQDVLTERKKSGIYIMYVYLAYIMTGMAFPMGVLDAEIATRVKRDVLSFLFSEKPLTVQDTQLNLGTEPYPYLRLIITTDVNEFCKAFASIMDDDGLNNEIEPSDLFPAIPSQKITRQLMLDRCLSIASPKVNGTEPKSDNHAVTIAIYSFTARCCSKYAKYLHFEDPFIESLINILVEDTNHDTRQEREISVLSLLSSGRRSSFDQSTLMSKYESLCLWRIYEFYARLLGNLRLVVLSYLNDKERKPGVFQAIRHLLEDPKTTYQQTIDIKQTVLENLDTLVVIDEKLLAQLMTDYWPTEHGRVLTHFSDNPKLAYAYLKGIMAIHYSLVNEPTDALSKLTVIRLNANPSPARKKQHNSDIIQPLSPEFFETYISLMCRYEPEDVLSYLVWLKDRHEIAPYDANTVLPAMKTYNVSDASAWILEQASDYSGALDVILERIEALIMLDPSKWTKDCRFSVLSFVDLAIGICARSLCRPNPEQMLELWFRLVSKIYLKLLPFQAPRTIEHHPKQEMISPTSSLLVPIRPSAVSPTRIAVDEATPEDFVFLVARKVMDAVLAHVPLSLVIMNMLQAQQVARVLDHRDLLFSMLDVQLYQRELFSASTRIIQEDTFRMLQHSLYNHTKGLRPIKGQCEVCHRLFHVRAMYDDERDERLVMFSCRHTFHHSCLVGAMNGASARMGLESADDYDFWCTVCGRPKSALTKTRKGKAKLLVKSEPDVSVSEYDTPRMFDRKVDFLYDLYDNKKPMVTILRLFFIATNI